jgi:hypothetical protein
MARRPEYPFVPRSTAYLEPGDFWSIPLAGGGFSCGRVIQLRMENGKRDLRIFLAGLMDWSGGSLPTADALAGCGVLAQGQVHIRTISENQGEVCGFRDLALDGIEPALFRDADGAICVQRGFEVVRPFDCERDTDLPVFGTWGYAVIRRKADRRFPNGATDRGPS